MFTWAEYFVYLQLSVSRALNLMRLLDVRYISLTTSDLAGVLVRNTPIASSIHALVFVLPIPRITHRQQFYAILRTPIINVESRNSSKRD